MKRKTERRLLFFLIGVMIGMSILVVLSLLFGCGSYRSWQRRQDRQHLARCVRFVRHPAGPCFAVNQCDGGMAVMDQKHCERKK